MAVVLGPDEARAQAALAALCDPDRSVRALGEALFKSRDDASSTRLARLLRPHARRIVDKDALARFATSRLKRKATGDDPVLALLSEASPERFVASMREAARAAIAGKDLERARALLAQILRSAGATDDDRLALALLELRRSNRGLAGHARQQDPALVLLCELARRGAPIAEALAADKSIEPELRFFVGFHLAELREGEGREAGHEVLLPLAKGRTKLSKQAKNKLKLTGYED